MVNLTFMGERLATARKLAGYDAATDACEALGFVYSTYMNHENGDRDFSRSAARYAKAYRVNLTWLLTGVGTPRGRAETHPVIELFEAIPAEKQPQAIEYLEFLRNQSIK